MAQMAAHADGVIVLTGCLQSRFCQHLIEGRPAQARVHADELINVFGADIDPADAKTIVDYLTRNYGKPG